MCLDEEIGQRVEDQQSSDQRPLQGSLSCLHDGRFLGGKVGCGDVVRAEKVVGVCNTMTAILYCNTVLANCTVGGIISPGDSAVGSSTDVQSQNAEIGFPRKGTRRSSV